MQACILSPYEICATARYPRIRVNGKKVAHSRYVYCKVHNLDLAEIAKFVVRHKCDNPKCINPEHLELGTQQDNVQDSVQRGRAIRSPGASNGRSKLTEAQAIAIRNSSELQSTSAVKYGVSTTVISQIRIGKLWSYLSAAGDQA